MNKSKTARVAAFVVGLGASAALIGAAAQGTGAYFQDSASGTLAGTTGHLTIGAQNDYALSFDKLIPGEYQSKVLNYHTGGDTAEDIWLYFPAGPQYGQFTGAKDNGSNNNIDGYADGGMGRFGHFAAASSDGTVQFSSYNLQNGPDGKSGCADVNGRGSGRQATSEGDSQMGYCGVPHYILMEQNVPSGSDGHVTLTFGVTGRQTQQGQSAPPSSVPFKVVATQHGIRPDAGNF